MGQLSRQSGKLFFYTEATFPEIDNSRVDELLLVVKGGVIKDAVILEMKNKTNRIDAVAY